MTLTSAATTNSGNYTVTVTNLSGSVTSSVAAVTIVSPPAVTAVTAPGSIQFNANTITGLTYVVETTTNLAAPVWTPMQTNNTGTSGSINYQTNTSSAPSQFFRLSFP